MFDLLGSNLLALIKAYGYKGIPVKYVKTIAKQILVGLNFIHKICRLVHTDLKPENILLGVTIKTGAKNDKSEQSKEDQSTKKTWFDFTKLNLNMDDDVMKQLCQEPANIGRRKHSFKNDVMDPKARDALLINVCPSIDISEFNYNYCKVKISDFGNACLLDKIRGGDIQTRQYRSPEVILRRGWDASADIWSFVCTQNDDSKNICFNY